MGDKLPHIDADGRARMVDVSGKPATKRIATAEGRVLMSAKALESVLPPLSSFAKARV